MATRLEVFVVGMFQENTYVIWDEDSRQAYIIDPGGENERVLEYLEKNNLKAIGIINTHGHIDHISGARELQTQLGIPFRIHKGDEEVVAHAKLSARFFGVEVDEPPTIDSYLEEGDEITLGSETIKVIHTPGHSPGGVCFLVGSEDVIVGDTLFAMSIGRTDLPGGSYKTIIESIKNKLIPLGDHMRVHPGHGPSTTIGQERRMNPFLA